MSRPIEYSDDEYLQLSGIQHFEFCPRQWALIHIEKQWSDNYFTASGNIIHENAHDPFFNEKRGGCIISRAMAIHSPRLGISGECDIVEFTRSDKGINLPGQYELWSVCPVEYKLGEPKENDCDRVQLAAQVICLEEMLVCDIPRACIYYNKIRRREYVDITDELRSKVTSDTALMHKYFDAGYTPRAKKSPKCRACSLADLCLPRLMSCASVADYVNRRLGEGDTV